MTVTIVRDKYEHSRAKRKENQGIHTKSIARGYGILANDNERRP